ncbi:Target of rapamycin complex 2 subunit TSC11 [Kluyveromyces marxianus]
MERQGSNADLYRLRSNTNNTVNGPNGTNGANGPSTGTKRQNLVLSTSFVSTRRFDDGTVTPTSPLLMKHRNSTINSLRLEMNQVEQEIERLRKKKLEQERVVQTSNSNDIYVDEYSTEHLENRSLRLRVNNELKETDQRIKRLQDQLSLLRIKLKRSEGGSGEIINSTLNTNHNQSLMVPNGSTINNTMDISDSGSDFEVSDEATYRLTPTRSIPALPFHSDDGDRSSDHLSANVMYESSTKETATWLISDHLQSLQDINASEDFILQKADGLVYLLAKNPEIKEDLVISAFASTIQNLLLHADQKIRSAGYRIVRYLILNETTIDYMLKLHIDVFITMSLGKDNSHQEEREQALKLIRRFIDFKGYGINKAITQAIVSCVEQPEDSLRLVAFETLIELTFINPTLVDDCKAFPIIQSFILDPNTKNEELAINSMIEMLSYPEIRPYFVKNFHTGYILSGFSDYQTKLTGSLEKVQRSVRVVIRILQDFNGILLFALNDCQLLNQLIAFAQSPLLFKHIINIFLTSLRIKKNTPERTDCSQVYQYVYLLVVMMNKADFANKMMFYAVECLPKLDPSVRDNTRLVIAKVCDASMQLSTGASNFQAVKFPEQLSQYKLFHETFVFNSAIYSTRSKLAITATQKIMLKSAGEMQLNSSKKDIDDIGFKKMVFDSKVLQTKSYSYWNWQVIGELCRSPLLDRKRLEELSRSTKFIRRMLVFYRPFRFKFTSVASNDPMANTYVEVGCLFFRALLSNNTGLRILADDTKIIPQVASVLYNNMQGHAVNDVLFTERALKEKLCGGYFKIIFGVFTENNNGMSLLEKWNVFTVINLMFSKRSLCTKYLMLTLPELNLGYSRCKMFLNKALLDDREMIRSIGTVTLGKKLQNLDNDDLMLEEYLIKLTCRQLYDLAPNVVAAADKILYDYCTYHVNSSNVLQPSIKNCLDQLIFIGSPTLLKLMENSDGFQQLNGLNYINRERIRWKESKNREFVPKVEQFLEQEIRKPDTVSKRSFPLHFYQFLCRLEEGANLLSKSDDIRQFIMVIKRHLNDIRAHKNVTYGEKEMIELKSCMWACGFIGSTDYGINLLDKYSFVSDIVELASESQYTCIKSTSFYVLGLVSYTMDGREMIEEIGWESIMDTRQQPIGVCVPKDARKLLHWSDLGPVQMPPKEIEMEWPVLKRNKSSQGQSQGEEDLSSNVVVCDQEIPLENLLEWERSEACVNPNQEEEDKQELDRVIREISQSNVQNLPHVFEDDKVNDRILRVVSDMGNNILLNGAIKEITSLETKYGPARFQSPEMFEQIFKLMSEYRFKPSVRKFLLELFINNRSVENLIRAERRRRR